MMTVTDLLWDLDLLLDGDLVTFLEWELLTVLLGDLLAVLHWHLHLHLNISCVEW